MSVDWKKWCRLCAGSEDVSFPLFLNDGMNEPFNVLEIVNKYLNVNISLSLGEHAKEFPQYVCKTCVKFLQEIDSFAVQSSKVQYLFYNLIVESTAERINRTPEDKQEGEKDLMQNAPEVDLMRNTPEVEKDETVIRQSVSETENSNHCNYEEKNYESIQIEPYDNDDKHIVRGQELPYKRKGKTGLFTRSKGRGRPRKCDRIVPRIRIRAIQPPLENNAGDLDCNADSQKNEAVIYKAEPGDCEQKLHESSAELKVKVACKKFLKKFKNFVEDKDDAIEATSDSTVHNTKESNCTNKVTRKGLKKSELKALVPSLYHFKCHVCDYICKNWNSLRTHCKETHGENALIKCDCGKILSTRTAIIEHRARHTDSDVYKCDSCEKTFHRKSLLNVHMMSHVPKEEQPFVCCKCARRFHCEALLRNHERVHLPKEERLVFPCDLCQKMFSSKSAVSAHLKAIHLRERPFVCDQCGNSFASKGILQEHLTIHSDDAPWNCTKCNKNFKTKYRLKIHMDTHRETPYQCPKCPVQLSTRRTLRMHLVVHRDTKAYQCSTCGKEFRRAKDLKNHNNLHTGRRPYTCPFCSRTFANGSNCRSHKRRMHPEELRMFELSGNTSSDHNIQKTSTEVVSNVNDNASSGNDKKQDKLNFIDIKSEQVPELSLVNGRKNDSATVNPFTSSFLSFVNGNEKRFSPVKHSNGLLQSSFNQSYPLEQVGSYSPCHEQDISSSAIPAFPGFPYIHEYKSILFHRSVEPS